MNRQKPLVKRDMGVFENRANRHRERLMASRALVETLACRVATKPIRFSDYAAMRTNRAVRPTFRFEMRSRSIFVVILGILNRGHTLLSSFFVGMSSA